MLIAAAVCPHPPLLVPEVTGASDPGVRELRRLRATCREAVAVLLGAAPDLLVVVGGAGHTAEYPPAAGGSLLDFAVPFTAGGDPGLPLSLTIGKWLLAGAAPGGPPAAWWGIAPDTPPAECQRLGERLAGLAPRVALLAVGDGPARRARAAPLAADPEADRYDDRVAGALAAAGVTDQADVDLWTAIQMGLTAQQLANDPGGRRFADLLDPAIDMFLASVKRRKRCP